MKLSVITLFVIIVLFIAIACATTAPTTCSMPDGMAMISTDDVDAANAEYGRVRRALDVCQRGRAS